MLISTFIHYFKRLGGVYITQKVVLLRKPLELYNLVAGKVIASFGSMDAVLGYLVDGKTIEQYIAGWERIEFPAERKGESGLSGSPWPSSGGFIGDDETTADYPARMNVKLSGAARSYDQMLREFTKQHGSAGEEHGIVVDAAGFVSKYRHGNSGSISGLTGEQNEIAIHNHPAGGWPNFSKEDILNTAMGTRRGIVAVSSAKGRNTETAQYAGTYTFTKGQNFKASDFVKAVSTAKISGKDYNDAVSRWLRANQKKYGYKYTYTKAK